jgi:hypothetical protein
LSTVYKKEKEINRKTGEFDMIEIRLKDKIVGHIDGDSFITIRKPEHYFRIFQGFAMSKELLHFLVDNRKVTLIKLIYKGKTGDKKYYVSPYGWLYKGFDYQADEYELQVVLPEDKFDRVE